MHGSREPSSTDWYLSIQVDLSESTSGVHHMSTSQNDRLHFAPWWSIGILSLKDKYVHERLLRVHLFSQVPAQNVLNILAALLECDETISWYIDYFLEYGPACCFGCVFCSFKFETASSCAKPFEPYFQVMVFKLLWLRRLNLGG